MRENFSKSGETPEYAKVIEIMLIMVCKSWLRGSHLSINGINGRLGEKLGVY